jgi:hypothetical protein
MIPNAYITGMTQIDSDVPALTDIWGGDRIYEYPDFLRPDHVSDILNRLASDSHLRYPYTENGVPDLGIWCMGQNFWSLPNHPEFDDVFDPELRSYMADTYSDINLLIENFCIKYFHKTPEYVPDIATPGFNIITSDISGTYWHTDGALYRKMPDIDPNRIISIGIPIQCDDQSHTEFKISDTLTYQATLSPGTMLIWPGRKLHRIGCQTIRNNHHRITYHCHIYDHGDRALIHF